jgi:hypothetical protein
MKNEQTETEITPPARAAKMLANDDEAFEFSAPPDIIRRASLHISQDL